MTNELRCWCQHCGTELPPDHKGPCPKCGKLGKHFEATLSTTIGLVASLSAQKVHKYIKNPWPEKRIMKCYMDGDRLCIVGEDFVNLQESAAIFVNPNYRDRRQIIDFENPEGCPYWGRTVDGCGPCKKCSWCVEHKGEME